MKSSINGDIGSYLFQHGYLQVDRSALLNHLIQLYGYRRFLEIGVRRRSDNYSAVRIAEKVGVDPEPSSGADFIMGSDEFFATYNNAKFDIVFVDGLHTDDQVERDIVNALGVLNPPGCILVHDVNPPTSFHARDEYVVDGETPAWNGTVWRGFARLRRDRSDLEMYVVDTDWSCGFIRPGQQETLTCPIDIYDEFERNRREILNLISVEKFLRKHPVTHSLADQFPFRVGLK